VIYIKTAFNSEESNLDFLFILSSYVLGIGAISIHQLAPSYLSRIDFSKFKDPHRALLPLFLFLFCLRILTLQASAIIVFISCFYIWHLVSHMCYRPGLEIFVADARELVRSTELQASGLPTEFSFTHDLDIAF
jgi:hypothetical protein